MPVSSALASRSVSDEETREALVGLRALGYLCEPHGAVAWATLKEALQPDELGIFLCTAHPAKFKGLVETLLEEQVEVPDALARHAEQPLLSVTIPPDFDALRAQLAAQLESPPT